MVVASAAGRSENFIDRTLLPLQLNVWLIGESGSDSDSQAFSSDLKKSLESVLPSYLPTVVSEFEFDITYNIMMSNDDRVLEAYNSAFQSTERDHTGLYSVTASSLSDFLQQLLIDNELLPPSSDASTGVSVNTLPIWIVLPNDYLPPHQIWSEDSDLCSQTFVGDILFVDLSAAACDMTKVAGGRAALAGSSAGDEWRTAFPPPPTARLSPESARVYLLARLSNVITSAVKQFVVSSLAHRATHSAGRILCPVVFLTSRASAHEDVEDDLLTHVSLSTKEIEFITAWLESFLLPHQEVHVFSATHYVEDHPQLSLALAAAARSSPARACSSSSSSSGEACLPPSEVAYLDSDNFLSELSKTGDSLTQRLLLDAGHGVEGDLLMEVEALFQNFRVGAQKQAQQESKLQRWMGEHDPHHYSRAPQDGLLSDRYTAAHERTKVVPVFVLSDIVALQAHVQAAAQRIFTDVPLFDQTSLVSCRKNVALVMHSTAYNTRVFEPNLRAHAASGSWKEVDLSDPTLLIAEGLAGSLAGLRSPHFRSEGRLGAGAADFTWGLGSHPFSPFSHVSRDWRERVSSPRFSAVLSWAARRGVLVSRANAALHRLQRLLDEGALFVKDVNRVLALFYELRHEAEAEGSGSGGVEHEAKDGDVPGNGGAAASYHNAAMERLVAEVFTYNVQRGGSAGADREERQGQGQSGVYVEELASLMREHAVLFRAVLQRVLDVRAGVAGAAVAGTQGELLLATDQLARVEAEVHDYKDKLAESERQVRDLLGRCDFAAAVAATVTAGGAGAALGGGAGLVGKLCGCGIAFSIFVFIIKKIQDKITHRNKKIA